MEEKYLLMATDKYAISSRYASFYGAPEYGEAVIKPTIKHVKKFLDSYDKCISLFDVYLAYPRGTIYVDDIGYFEVIKYDEKTKKWHIVQGDGSIGLSIDDYFKKLLDATKSANLRLRLTKNLIDLE